MDAGGPSKAGVPACVVPDRDDQVHQAYLRGGSIPNVIRSLKLQPLPSQRQLELGAEERLIETRQRRALGHLHPGVNGKSSESGETRALGIVDRLLCWESADEREAEPERLKQGSGERSQWTRVHGTCSNGGGTGTSVHGLM